DDHNEVCEVCDKGGDLLCCDTCSLVFHVRCIRPKLGAVPKGKWSCAYCVL
ncbi:the 2nd Phd domain from Mi2b with C terminal loop replaced By corresponding loop from Wstf, partial [Ochromonadaceae sp. CCMP2298]